MPKVIIELVGRTGCGKSTLSRSLRGDFDFVGPLTSDIIKINRGVILIRVMVLLFTSVAATPTLWRSAMRFARLFYAVEKSCAAIRRLPDGFSVIDEGPVHALCFSRMSPLEKPLWERYALRVLTNLHASGIALVVAEITLSEEVRFLRAKKRAAQQDRTGAMAKATNAEELMEMVTAIRPIEPKSHVLEQAARIFGRYFSYLRLDNENALPVDHATLRRAANAVAAGTPVDNEARK